MARERALKLASFFDATLVEATKPTTELSEKVKAGPALAAVLVSLGKLTGETRDITEAYITQLPAFRRIVAELRESLAAYPDAMRAAGERLLKLGTER